MKNKHIVEVVANGNWCDCVLNESTTSVKEMTSNGIRNISNPNNSDEILYRQYVSKVVVYLKNGTAVELDAESIKKLSDLISEIEKNKFFAPIDY